MSAEALRDGPYGRCVYRCDNDVVDHQVVNLRFAHQQTVTFTMTAFTKMEDRKTRLFGTRGYLEGDGEQIRVFDFLTDKETVHQIEEIAAGTQTQMGGTWWWRLLPDGSLYPCSDGQRSKYDPFWPG